MPTPDDAASPAPADTALATASTRLAVLDDLDDLDDLARRPLGEHADVYQALHAGLQAALAEIDSA